MFAHTVLVGTLAGLAAAQSAVLTFTHVPDPITDGQPAAITYATNDTASPVTIVLRQGLSTNLTTVETLTTTASNGQYIWTPCSSLPDGSDYALEIKQNNQINYFGPFSIQGSTGTGTCSGVSSSSSSASTTAGVVGGVPPGHSMTASASSSSNATMTGSGSAAGTGTAMSRNTTMSSATLTSSGLTSSGKPTGSAATTPAPTGTSIVPAPSTTSTNGGSTDYRASSLALILGAFAAIVMG